MERGARCITAEKSAWIKVAGGGWVFLNLLRDQATYRNRNTEELLQQNTPANALHLLSGAGIRQHLLCNLLLSRKIVCSSEQLCSEPCYQASKPAVTVCFFI